MDADRIIADIASAQHSAVSRRQLLAAGVPGHVIDRRVGARRLIPMHSGVYRPDGHPRSWRQTLMAAVLASGPGAVASHRAASFLHGISGIEPRAEVSVAAHRAPRTSDVLVHRVTHLPAPDVGLADGIPCTRPVRTLIDLAGVVGPGALEFALDDCLSRRLVSVAYLERRLDSLGRQGRDGARALADLLANRTGARPRSHSEFERRLVNAIRLAGLPAPQTQYEVALPGGRRAFLDVAYPEVMLAIEADSYRHHSSRTDWGRDRTRNRLLIALGWRILPVTWDDLVPDPAEVLSMIARSLNGTPRYAG
jgi:very-short-patch-repair endonuclease